MITLIYGCGLRISESLSIKLSDLNKEYISILGKGQKERSISVLEEVKRVIERYLQLCPYRLASESNVFVGIRGDKLNAAVFQRQIRKIRNSLSLSESVTSHISDTALLCIYYQMAQTCDQSRSYLVAKIYLLRKFIHR